MKYRIALAVSLFALSAGSYATTLCQEKEQNILKEISYAEKHQNQNRIDGLNKALSEVRANCSDSQLRADHQKKTMSKEHTTEHLRAELKSLSDTLEEVLSSSGEKSKEELSKIRSKAEQALKQSRYRLGETGDAIAKQTRVAAARADEYVRENPWTGVGIGAAIGVVLGVLLSRR